MRERHSGGLLDVVLVAETAGGGAPPSPDRRDAAPRTARAASLKERERGAGREAKVRHVVRYRPYSTSRVPQSQS